MRGFWKGGNGVFLSFIFLSLGRGCRGSPFFLSFLSLGNGENFYFLYMEGDGIYSLTPALLNWETEIP